MLVLLLLGMSFRNHCQLFPCLLLVFLGKWLPMFLTMIVIVFNCFLNFLVIFSLFVFISSVSFIVLYFNCVFMLVFIVVRSATLKIRACP